MNDQVEPLGAKKLKDLAAIPNVHIHMAEPPCDPF
jgi:hypothetical protein